MARWQACIILSVLDDVELKALKSIDGRTITTCCKGQPLTATLVVPFIKYNLPEPVHLLASRSEAIRIDAIVAQFFEIEHTLATNQSFQFFMVEQVRDDSHV